MSIRHKIRKKKKKKNHVGDGWVVIGSLSFNVQGWGVGGVLPNSVPFGQTEKGGRRVQKLDIFLGCHKCMVCNTIWCIKMVRKSNKSTFMPKNKFHFSIRHNML